MQTNDHSLVDLDPFLAAFHDLDVDTHRVTDVDGGTFRSLALEQLV
jgi:hypothetical protein